MDIILIVVMALSIFIGWKKGFIKVLFSMIGIFLAILLALISYKTVVKYVIPKTGLDQKVRSYVETKIDSKETSIIMPEALQEYVDANVIVNQAQSTLVEKLSNFIINVGTIIILVIIFYIIVTIIRILLDGIAKLPIFNIFNKIGGGLLGGIKAYILILLAFSLIAFIGVIGKGDEVIKFVNNSIVSKQIYNNNPIGKIIVSKQIEKNNNQVEENKKEGK